MVLTDHFLDLDGLKLAGEDIRAGLDVFTLEPALQQLADEQARVFEQMSDPEFRRNLAHTDCQGVQDDSGDDGSH